MQQTGSDGQLRIELLSAQRQRRSEAVHSLGVAPQILQTETQVETNFRAIRPDFSQPSITGGRVLMTVELQLDMSASRGYLRQVGGVGIGFSALEHLESLFPLTLHMQGNSPR